MSEWLNKKLTENVRLENKEQQIKRKKQISLGFNMKIYNKLLWSASIGTLIGLSIVIFYFDNIEVKVKTQESQKEIEYKKATKSSIDGVYKPAIINNN